MAEIVNAKLTRRFFLLTSVGVLIPRWTWPKSLDAPILCWKLQGYEDAAREDVSGSRDAIASRTGHAIWVGQASDRALRLDGYSVWVSHGAKKLPLCSRGFSISAWMALESYPVDEAAIVHLSHGVTGAATGSQPEAEFRFAVDRRGLPPIWRTPRGRMEPL